METDDQWLGDSEPKFTDKPIRGGSYTALPPLPDEDWLEADLAKVGYAQRLYNKKPVFAQDKNGNDILDVEGNRIPRMVFTLEFDLRDPKFRLVDGSPRHSWVSVGVAFGDNANLPVLLDSLGIQYSKDVTTDRDVYEALKRIRRVKFMVENKKVVKDGVTRIYSNPILSKIRRTD